MTTIKLQTALRLIRFNHDDPEVREIIQTAIDELDRLQELERCAIELAETVTSERVIISQEPAMAVLKLASK